MKHKEIEKEWILASASPRRKEILEELGLQFTVCPAQGEEKIDTTDPEKTVAALALQKAREVAEGTERPALVIGSDTVVASRGKILGKPHSEEEAFQMLKELQGAEHMVYTGAAVVDAQTGEVILNFAEGTRVSLYPMTDEWIRGYIATGEPMDKAGAYAIQGGCMPYIREIQGEYTTVVGFPAARFWQELLKQGIDPLELKRTGTDQAEELPFRACIFDLDGTLCDSVESIATSANQAMRDFGLREASVADYKIFVGDGVDMLIRRLLTYAGDPEGTHFEEVRERYLEYFETGCLYHVTAYPGIKKALSRLKEQGAKLAVLSNKPHENTKNVVESVFGPGVFDWVQGQSGRFPRKPDPAGALYIAEQLGVKPEDCMYMGDTGTDMQTGKAAGMYTTGVLWGFREEKELRANGADAIVSRGEELPEIYEKGRKKV